MKSGPPRTPFSSAVPSLEQTAHLETSPPALNGSLQYLPSHPCCPHEPQVTPAATAAGLCTLGRPWGRKFRWLPLSHGDQGSRGIFHKHQYYHFSPRLKICKWLLPSFEKTSRIKSSRPSRPPSPPLHTRSHNRHTAGQPHTVTHTWSHTQSDSHTVTHTCSHTPSMSLCSTVWVFPAPFLVCSHPLTPCPANISKTLSK